VQKLSVLGAGLMFLEAIPLMWSFAWQALLRPMRELMAYNAKPGVYPRKQASLFRLFGHPNDSLFPGS